MTDINQLLKAGIKALKAGKRDEARKLLMQVVKLDEDNERAWLWLSGAVKSKDERRICLENVLTINPDNEMAKKGLIKMGFPIPEPVPEATLESEEDVIEDWTQPVFETTVAEPNDPHKKTFQDVWASDNKLCAYCATPISKGVKRCTNCKRSLIGKELINPGRSKYLTTWISLRSIGHVLSLLSLCSLIFTGIDVLAASLPNYGVILIGSTVNLFLSIGFTIAMFFRKTWAYWTAVVFIALFYIALFGLSILAETLVSQPAGQTVPTWITLICAVPFIGIQLAYVYMVFMSAGDFKREKQWRIAAASSRITDPRLLDKAADYYAKQKMWATAVKYWQRAVGMNPGNTAYLRRLAKGYAQLGFPERSLDTLKLALEKAREPKVRRQITSQIAFMENQLDHNK
ncbi:MAG: hypothetical protein GY943_10095 [Chloroflexi bacterium]|nr:hypothetical protein [Chloroflexota bacterium]